MSQEEFLVDQLAKWLVCQGWQTLTVDECGRKLKTQLSSISTLKDSRVIKQITFETLIRIGAQHA